MKRFVMLFDAFFLMRPLLLVPVWGFSVFGLYRGLHAGRHSPEAMCIPLHCRAVLFFWMIVFSLSVASVYVLNQIADVKIDKCNYGTPLLARDVVSEAQAWVTALACALVSIVAPLFVHPMLSAIAAAALLLGIVYSFQPPRFSGRCFLDFLSNGAGYGIIAFGAGWYLSGAHVQNIYFITNAMPYFLLMCAGSISSTLPDMDADKKYGKNTTAVTLGITPSHALATCLLFAALIVAIVLKDILAAICAACSLPFYLLYAIKPGPRNMEATYKGGGVLCMAAAAVLMPLVAVAAAGIGLSTFAYFKIRHHTTYPTLLPVRHEE